MARTLPVFALLLVLPCLARADEPPAETVVRLTVTPQALPAPALRYQLLPEMREMNPGNPIQGYLECFMEENYFFFGKTEMENRDKWLAMPLKDLPVKELHDYGGAALRRADYAARLDTPDWQILPRMHKEGLGLLIPEVQWLRTLAAALAVRLRAEVAERRYDDALVTARTLFTLSRCLGRHPTLIGNLVGSVVGNMAVGPMEEMVGQPGCPNLYWALTDLPAPFIDFREGRQGEILLFEAEARLLDENAPMSDAQIDAALDKVKALLEMRKEWGLKLPAEDIDPAAWVADRAKDKDRVGAARQRLVESGLDAEKVKQFPARQVILLDEKLKYRTQLDDDLKRMGLPYWEDEKLRAAASKGEPGESLYGVLTPAFGRAFAVRQAGVRLDQRLALLRCVEALRAYAAENDGKLPAKLDDVKLSLPADPVTGKPFPYHLDGGTATLRGTPPAGREKDASFNVRYEVTIAK